MDDWEVYDGLFTRLAAPADWDKPAHWSRKVVRSMGRIAMMAVKATEDALAEAGLSGSEILSSGRARSLPNQMTWRLTGILKLISTTTAPCAN